MLTNVARRRFVAASMLLALLAGCTTITAGTETERAICQAWGEALPTRSRSDTIQTQAEIGVLYDVFEAACPRR